MLLVVLSQLQNTGMLIVTGLLFNDSLFKVLIKFTIQCFVVVLLMKKDFESKKKSKSIYLKIMATLFSIILFTKKNFLETKLLVFFVILSKKKY